MPRSNFNARIIWPVLLTLVCALPPGPAGAAAVAQGANPASASPSIRVIGIAPSIAPATPAGGIGTATEVIITGENFQPGAGLKIGEMLALVVSVSPTQIRATAPREPAGIADVTVNNPDGSAASLPKAFTFTTGPIIYSVSPQTGAAADATVVMISGGNLQPDSKILVGGQAAAIQQFFSSLLLMAQVPANAGAAAAKDPAPADVTITNADGQSFTLPKAFTWTTHQVSPGAASQGSSAPPS